MAFLKKINNDWQPQEYPHSKVGDIIDFPGPVENLIKEGNAILVDESGKELPAPGTVFTCAICFAQDESLEGYLEHVIGHSAQPERVLAEKPTATVQKEVDELKATKKSDFGERMRLAREKKKAEKLAKEQK